MKKIVLFVLVLWGSWLSAQEICEVRVQLAALIEEKSFEKAEVIWKDYLENCSSKSEEVFQLGEKIYQHGYEAAVGEQKKELAKQLLEFYGAYDQAFPENINENFMKRGMLWYESFENEDEAYNALFIGFAKMNEPFSNPLALSIYFKLAQKKLIKAQNPAIPIYKLYFKLLIRVSENKKKYKDQSSEFENVKLYLNSAIRDFQTCEVFETYLKSSFDAQKSELKWIELVTEMIDETCMFSIYYADYVDYWYSQVENSNSAYHMGNLRLKRNDLDNAVLYFEKSLALETDNTLKAIRSIQIATQLLGTNNRKAMQFLQTAALAEPKNPRVYMFMGEVYENTIAECQFSGKEREALYELAAKTVLKAAEADKRFASAAQKKAQEYRKNVTTPNGKKTTVAVGCWINQTVTW
jgi:hypothetical protein